MADTAACISESLARCVSQWKINKSDPTLYPEEPKFLLPNFSAIYSRVMPETDKDWLGVGMDRFFSIVLRPKHGDINKTAFYVFVHFRNQQDVWEISIRQQSAFLKLGKLLTDNGWQQDARACEEIAGSFAEHLLATA